MGGAQCRSPQKRGVTTMDEGRDEATNSSPYVFDISPVDSTPLDFSGDLFNVLHELTPVAAKWRSIGIALRLNPHILDSVQADNDDSAARLRSVITEWLKRNYNVEKFGEPTWKQLVDAVRDPAGGANMALAREIARRHKAQGPTPSRFTTIPHHLCPVPSAISNHLFCNQPSHNISVPEMPLLNQPIPPSPQEEVDNSMPNCTFQSFTAGPTPSRSNSFDHTLPSLQPAVVQTVITSPPRLRKTYLVPVFTHQTLPYSEGGMCNFMPTCKFTVTFCPRASPPPSHSISSYHLPPPSSSLQPQAMISQDDHLNGEPISVEKTATAYLCMLIRSETQGENQPEGASTQKRNWMKDNEEPKPKPSSAHDQGHLLFTEALNPFEKPPKTVGEVFRDTKRSLPKHPALKYKEDGKWKAITYTEYYEYCIKAAKSFLQLGLEPKHGVAIIGYNSHEWLISSLGAVFAGGVPTGIYETSDVDYCHFVANSCKASIIVVENQEQLDKILEVRDRLPHLKAIVQYKGNLSQEYPNVYEWKKFLEKGDEIETNKVEAEITSQKPDQCALLIYTSGTSGISKGVKLSHDNLTFTANAIEESYGRLEYGRERGVSYLPLSHISAQMTDIYLPLLVGATVHFVEKGLLVQTLQEVQPTFFFGVPRVYEKIMEHLKEHDSGNRGLKGATSNWAKRKGLKGNENRQKNHSLPWGWTISKQLVFKKFRKALGLQQCKICVVGADPIDREVLKYFMSINIPLMELYGLSECSGCHTVNLRHNQDGWRVGTCGKPINGVKLKISKPDETGEGEICLYGRHVFLGYHESEEETSKAIDTEGWLHSGDLGTLQDGFLCVTCRKKDLITLSSGEKINPLPIEKNIKNEIPFLSNVMVVGHQREFLTCLLTLKCQLDYPDTGTPLDILTPQAQQHIQDLGSHNTEVSEIIGQKDQAVFTAIQKGLDRVNELATQAKRVQKWTLLPSDFSIPGGELGPTLKVRRPVVYKKYEAEIDAMYSETEHQNT